MFSTRLSKARLMPLIMLAALGLSACGGMSATQKGAVTGTAAGAVVGAAVGNAAGSTAKGAILGAVVGGAAGAVIGRRMDRQATMLADELPDAEIRRLGEGIQVTFDSGILFGFDSSELQETAKANLTSLAESLDSDPDTDLLIVGHTDALGPEGYNLALSERRSRAAATYLASQGVSAERIDIRGRGEGEPVADNATELGRDENRRVEIAIYASEKYRARLTANPRSR